MKENTTTTERKREPTIWRIDDVLWAKIEPLLPPPGPKKSPAGRPRVSDRIALDGILYVLRSGCPWKHVPKEFSSGSTCHLRFSTWVKEGVFAKLWAVLTERYDDLIGIEWDWQSIDAALGKSPGIVKKGLSTKKSVITPPTVGSQEPRRTY